MKASDVSQYLMRLKEQLETTKVSYECYDDVREFESLLRQIADTIKWRKGGPLFNLLDRVNVYHDPDRSPGQCLPGVVTGIHNRGWPTSILYSVVLYVGGHDVTVNDLEEDYLEHRYA